MKTLHRVLCLLLITATPTVEATSAAPATTSPSGIETLATNTPRVTSTGHRYIAPAGWTLRSNGTATILTAPEGDSRVVLIDTAAQDADAAVAAAWAAYGRMPEWPLQPASDRPSRNGWAQIRSYRYDTPAQTQREVFAQALRHDERWTVVIADLATAVADKRGAQLGLIFGRLQAKGYSPETFAGKTAHKLAGERIEALTRFVEQARVAFDVPGVALGVVQDGKTVFAGGFGVRELGKPDKVDADTVFFTTSVTKPLTTLMLAKLVDAGRFDWDTPVTEVMPSFKLGNAETTRQVRIKHLVCACTGLPRQDREWEFASEGSTPATVLARLATMQPTAKFGELYQYSNPLAAAGGYVGAHALHPQLELGAAYDHAMQTLVFEPLGMTSTTFDFERAQRGNYAAPHAQDIDGRTVRASMAYNYTSIPMRPDGGAWSNVNDLLRYLQMELRNGRLPEGRRYIGEAALLARREPQVARGADQAYGIGLKLNRDKGTLVAWHGGTMPGYQAEILWLPEHDVGAVLLVNADAGAYLRGLVDRRLLELLFDARPEAAATLASLAKSVKENAAAERKRLGVPADPTLVAALAAHYRSSALGEIKVVRKNGALWFDFGDWDSEVATRRDADGSKLFVTISPGVAGFEFIVADNAGHKALLLRDEQREYRFIEVADGGAQQRGKRSNGSAGQTASLP